MQTKSTDQFRAYHFFDCGKVLPPIYSFIMEENTLFELQKMMSIVYQVDTKSSFSMVCQKFARFELGSGQLLTSILSSNVRNACIAAYWPSEGDFNFNMAKPNVGEIQLFVRQQTTSDCFVFAYVKWHHLHSQWNWFGSSAIVCSVDHVPTNHFSFIPVH